VKITDLRIPPVVKNGSLESAILDCLYDVEDGKGDGLVVTWYFDGSPAPVYQWIPPNRPQDLGKLKDRLDLNFTVSSDPYERYRALRIIRPTIELHGEFSCKVSTFDAEDVRTANMIVYGRNQEFKLNSRPMYLIGPSFI
jgi:hypothetical protein